jgi:putative nucleotidyltransferase with HDIG domain
MVKKIKVEQLKPGMFISDLDCGWLRHSFITNKIKINHEDVISKIIHQGICEVYIDTDKGLDVSDAPTAEEVNQEIQSELYKIVEQDKDHDHSVPVHEEIIKAKNLKKESIEIVQNLMGNVALNKPIKVSKVEHVVEKLVNSIFRNQDALMSLSRIRTADDYTYAHSISVCIYMVSFGKYLGYDSQLLKKIGIGALLHDIGKTKIPLAILNKKDNLSEQEYEIIKEHVEFGKNILEQSGSISETSIITAYQHHEREDGTGYPQGLSGDDITEYGKAISIIDVYDAISSNRSYKLRVEPTLALKKLFEWSTYHFNSELVQKFVRCVGIYPVGTLVLMESGWVGVVIKQGERSLLQPVVRLIYNKKTDNYLRVPYDVDLSEPSARHGKDRIVNYESPDTLDLQPEMYL